MKNNVLHRFAINDLKTHYQDVKWSVVTIFIAAILGMLISFFSPYILNQRYLEYQKNHGIYDYSFLYVSPEDIDNIELYLAGNKIKLDDPRLSVCYMIHSGFTFNNESMTELKGNPAIVSTHIKEGRMPTDKSEIAVKEKVFKNWGYSQALNQVIQLSFTHEENLYVQEFKVVGILKETGSTDIAVSKMFDSNCSIYIDVEGDMVLKSMSNYEFILSVSKDDLGAGTYYNTNMILLFIQLIIILLAGSLLYGLTLSSFEKKQRDYVLLRSMGATQRQIYYIIFIQVLLLSICPLAMSLILVYIISLIIPHVFLLPLHLPFQFTTMLWNSVIVFILTFICYFMPARSACRHALLGTFEEREFRYFYYRYKKLHQIRPFYLAWRQLISLKKKMIVKIIFISIISIACMSIIGDQVYCYIIEEYQVAVGQKEENLEYTLLEGESMDVKDFDVYKSFSKNITFYQYYNRYNLQNNLSQLSNYTFPYTFYCINDNLKQQYQISELKPHQVIFSRRYMNERLEKHKVYDQVDFLGDEYELVQIIEDTFASIAIVSETDFYKYQFMKPQYSVIIQFDDIHQKTQAYLNKSQEIWKLNDKYYCDNGEMLYGYMADLQSDYKTLAFRFWMNIFIIVSLSIVYIYQFIFEILKQREDIGSYQLLGMTCHEIWQIYFYKSVFIGMIGIFCGSIFYFLNEFYAYYSLSIENGLMMSLFLGFLVALFVIVIVVIISLIPLRYIVKRDAFDNKNVKE